MQKKTCRTFNSVRVEGLEPPCLAAPDPKSGMSTNFTTPACSGNNQLLKKQKIRVANVGHFSKKKGKERFSLNS